MESFFRWATDEAGISVALPRVPKEKEPPGRFRWLTAEEITAVRTQCEPEWWTLFALLINTGLRVGEATALTWDNINFRAGHIEVRKKNVGAKKHRIKTPKSARLVFLTDELRSLLVSHLGTVPNRPVDYVFPDERGNRHKAYKKWVTRVKRAGIPHATIHDLRHTFSVHALMGGVLLPRLQKLLGHASPAMTLRYAQHLPNDYFVGDAKLLSKSLSSEVEVTRPTLAVLK